MPETSENVSARPERNEIEEIRLNSNEEKGRSQGGERD